MASTTDWILGIPFGAALNVLGIVKPIDLLARADSPYAFPVRNPIH